MTQILPPIPPNIALCAETLRQGDLVGIPTETVYGLAGNALDERAVARIFAAKTRPSFNPLIVHVVNLAAAKRYAEFGPEAEKIASIFWPGPLTLVLPAKKNSGIARLATANLPTIAIRVPAHPIAQQLLQYSGLPLAAPSANQSGHISPTKAQHVIESLDGKLPYVLNGGDCRVGLESTIVDLSESKPTILRLGGLDIEPIEAILGKVTVHQKTDGGAVKAPGMLLRHYAPKIPLRLGCDNPRPNEALLAFGMDIPNGFAKVLNLSAIGDPIEAAANLYSHLHDLDLGGFSSIAVMPIPETGLGLAINDRLRRACESQKELSCAS
ncbi:MAG: threonylcarbamoyl-AMP synthase [Alphaproteobacteria bacterium]|nr:MAG: threonylcarbamoyl-AMP synthase [Alphaproteobacteria bacterium]